MRRVSVLGYEVRVAGGLLDEVGAITHATAPADSYAIITDDHVGPHWLAPVVRSFDRAAPASRVFTKTVAAGEERKTRETWAALTDWMLESGCGRDTTVVALGGGVIGDLAGFVAATFMRGVPVVQIPTSLLAMVDAAIGGKTGVDTPAGKNLVGSFHQPAAVVVDPVTLSTLPADHVRAGFAEVIKHGAIADEAYFESAAAFAASAHLALLRRAPVAWLGEEATELVSRSAAIKADIVRRDEREAGLRQTLNAGHTVAHAIELTSGYGILHGEAVSIGLVTETHLAETTGLASPGTTRRVEAALGGAGLPVAVPAALPVDGLIAAMHADKKVRGRRLAFALLARIGRIAGGDQTGWTTMLDEGVVRAALNECRQPPAERRPVGAPAS